MKTENNLAELLGDPRCAEFIGGGFRIKLDVLAALLTNSLNVAALAREHGISRQIIHRHVARARKIYGLMKMETAG